MTLDEAIKHCEEYRIDLGGYISFNVVDAEDLTEKLGDVLEDDK